MPHKYKIVIAGNHELDWDSDTKDLKNELTNCTYLEDSSVEIHGLKIYGKTNFILLYFLNYNT